MSWMLTESKDILRSRSTKSCTRERLLTHSVTGTLVELLYKDHYVKTVVIS